MNKYYASIFFIQIIKKIVKKTNNYKEWKNFLELIYIILYKKNNVFLILHKNNIY